MERTLRQQRAAATNPSGKRGSNALNSGHPTSGGTTFNSSVSRAPSTRDRRNLPYPQHGKYARRLERSTGRQAWTWSTWKDWLSAAVKRKDWRKAPLRRMLHLRAIESRERGDRTDYHNPRAVTEQCGMLYAAFHFPTGRWYVGQTINTIAQRARQHWWARRDATDYLHLALADDPDPMTWLALPLERIPPEEWREPMPHSAGWRDKERTQFRKVATIRERYWVNKLTTLWPKGWNSQYPGKPAKPGYRRPSPPQDEASKEEDQPARDLQAATAAVRQWTADPAATQAWLAGASREDLVEILEGLQKGMRPVDQTAVTKAICVEIRDVLRRRREQKKPRDFVRFWYGNRLAADMDLPGILRDPAIYRLHPEPEVAAAIMVVHRFAPQIASDLFNYHVWSAHPLPLTDLPAPQCPCHSQVLPGTTLVEGHVLSTEVAQLRSPYLQDILAKGKKYRLEQPLPSILLRLNEGLKQYVTYKVRAARGDHAVEAALEAWSKAVMDAARAKLQHAAGNKKPAPDGYPGLKEQLKAAQNALVFGPEDRAPHALFFACGRYYASKLHTRLADGGAFITEARCPAEALQDIETFNNTLGLGHHNRLPYLYGAWKAKKEAFRWIAGTSRKLDQPLEEGATKEEGAPKNALTEAAELLVKVLQHILEVLRAKDLQRRAQGHAARYWVIQDIDEFVQEFRVAANELSKVPWATWDFTTMYESLQHQRLVDGCAEACKEAWDFAEETAAHRQGLLPSEVKLCLSRAGWRPEAEAAMAEGVTWFTPATLKETLTSILNNLYVFNGGVLKRQVRGIPMGLGCAPQLANLYGYAVESKWVDAGGDATVLRRRYIGDIIAAGVAALQPGVGIPSEDDYGMRYKKTSDHPHNLIFIGIRLFVDDKNEAHTMLHDRAVDYPIRVDRYPEASTVANPAQLGGVIMGRLVAAQRTCSRLDLMQDAVAGIFTHAHRRNYPRRLIYSTWTRFLHKYWDAASVTGKELRSWFHKVWKQIVEAEDKTTTHHQPAGASRRAPAPAGRVPPPRAEPSLPPSQPPEPYYELLALLSQFENDDYPPPSGMAAELAIFLQQRYAATEHERTSAIDLNQASSSSRLPPIYPGSCDPTQRAKKQKDRQAHTERVNVGPMSEGPTPMDGSGLTEERYPGSSDPTQRAKIQEERQAHTERVNVGPMSEGPTPMDGSGLTETRYPCASDPSQGKRTLSEWPAQTERVNVGLGPAGDALGPIPPASSGLANVRYPSAPDPSHSPPQEGQLTVFRPGTGPLTSTEVYIERAVPVAVPHPVYVDRPVYIEKYCHIPYPVHVPVPYYLPAPDPHLYVTNTLNNHLHLHAASTAIAQEEHQPLRIEAPPASAITEIPEDPQPAILLPAPPSRMDQDRGPTKRSAAEALCEMDDEDDTAQPLTPSQRARKQKMTLTPERRAELEAYKQEETAAARRRRWSTWDDELEAQIVYHLWGERREEIKRWRRSAPPSPRGSHQATSDQNPMKHEEKHDETANPASQGPTVPSTFPEDAVATCSTEEHSHDWKEGARIGEALNPGPNRRTSRLSRSPRRSHTPQGRTNQKPTQASRRGDRAASKAPAGERTKGNRPGPKPSDDRAGNRPGGNGGGDYKAPAAMKTHSKSSAGTAQRTQTQRKEERRQPQEEGWQKVQGKKMKAMYEDIERMAERLRRLVDEVTFLRRQGREPTRQTTRDSNPWSPLAPKAAPRRKRSIGDQPPSRTTSVDTRDRERGRRNPRPRPRPRSPASPQRGIPDAATEMHTDGPEGMLLGVTIAQHPYQRAE